MNAAPTYGAMKGRARGILFAGAMVRAILDGRKTVTRRLVDPKFPTDEEQRAEGWQTFSLSQSVRREVKMYSLNDYERLPKEPGSYDVVGSVGWMRDRGHRAVYRTPYGVAGDYLWVRETWSRLTNNGIRIVYRADGEDPRTGWGDVPREKRPRMTWFPSIHLERKHSRILLEIVDVRAERLHAISEEDAKAEGVRFHDGYWCGAPHEIKGTPRCMVSAVAAFADLWDHINGKRATWRSNPWVWRIAFQRVRGQ